jgi:hypothetical protein
MGAIYTVIGQTVSYGGFDPQSQSPLCPLDNSPCRCVGSSLNPWRCIANGHVWTWSAQYGLYLASPQPGNLGVSQEYPSTPFDPSQ